MKATNYRYLKFISSLDDHSGRNENFAKSTYSIVEKAAVSARLTARNLVLIPTLE